nr:MAG TPA: hypothetical protein [Caudoviricetes sp.]
MITQHRLACVHKIYSEQQFLPTPLTMPSIY